MATTIIKKGAATVFVGRYPALSIAQTMATVKAVEYGVGAAAWTHAQDLTYNNPSTVGASQAWTK